MTLTLRLFLNMKVKPQLWKLMQRRIYDLLSHRYGLLTIIFAVVFITISAFHFGEVVMIINMKYVFKYVFIQFFELLSF